MCPLKDNYCAYINHWAWASFQVKKVDHCTVLFIGCVLRWWINSIKCLFSVCLGAQIHRAAEGERGKNIEARWRRTKGEEGALWETVPSAEATGNSRYCM